MTGRHACCRMSGTQFHLVEGISSEYSRDVRFGLPAQKCRRTSSCDVSVRSANITSLSCLPVVVAAAMAHRHLLQVKPTPCFPVTTPNNPKVQPAGSKTQPTAATAVVKPAVKASAALRQLLQAPVRPRTAPAAVPPANRQGFATGRKPGLVPQQQRRPVQG